MRPSLGSPWVPVAVLAVGAVSLVGVRAQRAPELRAPLDQALPVSVAGLPGTDAPMDEDVAQVVAFTDYALRVYREPAAPEADGDGVAEAAGGRWVSVYAGYYAQQTQGRTIHSPRNCMPGSGWEALSNRPVELGMEAGAAVTVNRYVLQNGEERVLVLYWYQGRGRVAHDEYLVKWDLLRDAVLKRRTDEALVRIVVPVHGSEDEAFEVAAEVAREIKPALDEALPAA